VTTDALVAEARQRFEKVLSCVIAGRAALLIEAIDKAGVSVNGWRLSSLFGDAAFFNGDWLKRAAGAKAGIYGNDAVEATYPLGKFDSEDKPLDGSQLSTAAHSRPALPPPDDGLTINRIGAPGWPVPMT